MKKYLFLDIDGTLVGFDGRMPESAKYALVNAQKNGHEIFLSTGRMNAQIYRWLTDEIAFDGVISSSGAIVCYHGEKIASHTFTTEQVTKFEDTVRSLGGITFYHGDGSPIAAPGECEREIAYFIKCGLKLEQFQWLYNNLLVCNPKERTDVEKAIYLNSGIHHDEMRSLLGDTYKIDGYSFGGMDDTCGEVTLAEVNKAAGIAILLNHIGASREDAIAFGDGGNDLDMIAYAGIGVAMGNSVQKLKDTADYVTDDLQNDGLYHAFRHFGLI